VTATNESGEVQLLEVSQFGVGEHPTAFHIPDNQAVSTSPNTVVGNQFVYANSSTALNGLQQLNEIQNLLLGLDPTNIVHEFLPQMAVFLPPNAATPSTSNQVKASTSASGSQSANPRTRSKENQIDENEEQPKKKFISPFAPEATVPLPSQLDELGYTIAGT
jgi:hypothetical protein